MNFYCHANLIEKNKLGTLIIGKEQSGKSTLSYFFIKYYGYSLIADDLVGINITKNNIIGYLVNTNFKGMIWLPFLNEKVLKTKHTYNYVKISQLIVLGKIPQNLEKHYQFLAERINVTYF